MPEAGQGSQRLFRNHLLITVVLGVAAVGLWVASFDHASVGGVLLALAITASLAAAIVGAGCVRQRSTVDAIGRPIAELSAEMAELTMVVSSLARQAAPPGERGWAISGVPATGAQIYDLGRRTADGGGSN